MKEKLQFIMEGGSVLRYHTRPGIRTDTDAHHMHGVAVLCSLLAGTDAQGRSGASASLLLAALTHDLAEQAASDMSAPSKRALGLRDMLAAYENKFLQQYGLEYTRYLTADELIILALADQFDGLMYCCRELALGNRNVMLVWRRQCSYIETISGTLPIDIALRASVMYESIKEIYREVTSVSGPEFDVFAEPK